MGIALVVTAVLGRILDTESFGFFAYVTTVFFVAHVFLDLGTGSVGVRAIVHAPDTERRTLEGLLGWRRACGWVLAGAVVVLALLEGDPRRRVVLLGAAGVLTVVAPIGLYVALQVRQTMGGVALAGFVNQVLVLLGTIALGALRVAGPFFAGLVVVRELLYSRTLRWLGARALGYLPRPRLRSLGPHARAAVILGLATLSQTLYFHADVFLVRLLRGEAELGAYAAAFRPVNPLLTIPGLLLVPILPVLAATAAGNRPRFARQVRGAATLMVGVGVLGGVVGAGLAPELMRLVYGGRYLEGGLEAVDALRWMAVAFAAVFTAAPFTTALLADGQERRLLLLGLGGLVVNISGNCLLLPRYGFTAAAATTAATEMAVALGAMASFVGRAGAHGLARRLLAALAPAALLGLVLWVVPARGLVRTALGVGLAGLGAAALLASPLARRFRADVDAGQSVDLHREGPG